MVRGPSSLPTWLHKGRFPLPWTQAGTCFPLRPPRACMSNPEENEVGEMGKATQVTMFHVGSQESTPEGHPALSIGVHSNQSHGFSQKAKSCSEEKAAQTSTAANTASWRHCIPQPQTRPESSDTVLLDSAGGGSSRCTRRLSFSRHPYQSC